MKAKVIARQQALARHIAKRQQMEIALRESEQRLADIINFLPDPIFAIDLEGRLIAWNRAVEETTGVPAQEMMGKGNYEYAQVFYNTRKPILIDLVLDPDRDIDRDYKDYHFTQWNKDTIVAEMYVPNWNRKRSYLWCKANPLYDSNGNVAGAIESVRDISDRKQTEKALQQSEKKYRTLFNTMNEGLALLEILYNKNHSYYDFRYLEVNPGYEKMFGYSRNQLIGKTLRQFFPQDRIKLHIDTYWEVIISGEPQEFQWYEPSADKYFEVNAFKTGMNQCGALFIDITERKKTEQALRLSEEKFFKAFSSSPNLIGICILDDGRYVDVNDNFCLATGYSREEIFGHPSIELDLLFDASEHTRLLHLIKEKGSFRNVEIHLRTKSGEERVGLASAELIDINREQYIIVTIVDITECKQMEDNIARLDRLNLVGEMAASIGHEIRNPMTTVRGFLQMLQFKEQYADDSSYFKIMIEELDRANAIISEFLSLARNKNLNFNLQNINSVLENLYPLIQADAIGQGQHLNLELGNIPDLSLDEKETRQLILNLVRNGMESMPSGGTITIKTRVQNNEVLLSVKDEGSGINPLALKKIGTPFFTTKDKGTGLGLSVCYSIAARHHAHIEVETGLSGTTFFVHYPISTGSN